MKKVKKLYKEAEEQEDSTDSTDIKDIIKELIDTDWSGSNEEQMKAVQLLKGVATSDDPMSNKFMKYLDQFTSKMNADEFMKSSKEESRKTKRRI